MNDMSLTKISAVFSFLSVLTVVAAIPIAIASGGGPSPDYGDAGLLELYAGAMPLPLVGATLALIGPTLALGAGIGWYVVLRGAGSYVALGWIAWGC